MGSGGEAPRYEVPQKLKQFADIAYRFRLQKRFNLKISQHMHAASEIRLQRCEEAEGKTEVEDCIVMCRFGQYIVK